MAVDPTPVLWDRILDEVQRRLPTPQAFDTWFQPVRARVVTDVALELEAPSLFFVQWIQQHYLEPLAESAHSVLGAAPTIRFTVVPELAVVPTTPARVPVAAPRGGLTPAGRPPLGGGGFLSGSPESDDSGLLPRYTFDTFVVGGSNQMSYAAASAAAEQPGRIYNPLVIYGGTGLGKTHLSNAIGHRVRQDNPGAVIFYMSAEKFMNQMIAAIQAGTTIAFRDKYRRADVLLIDDIQFLATKDATQEEFFHTFNALYGAGSQIVLTSDKPPREIEGLAERLVSRFHQGLVVDVKPPDLETRVAILQKRAVADRFYLPGPIALLIASHVKGNVRELEGCLLRLIAYTSMARRSEPTEEMAQDILAEFVHAESLAIDPETIVNSVVVHYGVTRDQLMGKRRTASVALPRQVAMHLMRRQTTLSLSEIGRIFDRDHTTVMHACDKIERLKHSDRRMKEVIERLAETIQNGR